MNGIFRFQLFGLLVVIISFTAFAFASSRTGAPAGGEGAGPISGWTVSGIHYVLAEDSSLLAAVEFDLDQQARTVRVGFSSREPLFFECVNPTARHWVCDLESQWRVSDLDQFRVIAVGGAPSK